MFIYQGSKEYQDALRVGFCGIDGESDLYDDDFACLVTTALFGKHKRLHHPQIIYQLQQFARDKTWEMMFCRRMAEYISCLEGQKLDYAERRKRFPLSDYWQDPEPWSFPVYSNLN